MALYSMTGFGKAKAEAGSVQLEVEMKSVNHRFLDVNMRTPAVYNSFEHPLQKAIAAKLGRGRIEVSVSRKESGEPEFEVKFNRELFQSYVEAAREALSVVGTTDEEVIQQAAIGFLQKREVIEVSPKEASVEAEFESLKGAVMEALDGLIEMRRVEGKALEGELGALLKDAEKLLKDIISVAKKMPEAFHERLTQRLAKLKPEVEVVPERLAQEVALLADRTDVTEEIARLESHVAQFRQILKDGGGGRKLEFLLQEMGREVNTIGSKAQHGDITSSVIEAKSVLEKLREQVLNIE